MTTSACPLVRRCPAGIWLTLGLLLLLPRLSADVSIATESPGNPVLPRQYAPGSSVKFITVVPDPAATYQWLHDGVTISGATASSLPLTNLSTANSGNYQLKATAGSTVSLSNTLTVNVLPLPASPTECQSSISSISFVGISAKQPSGALPSSMMLPPQITQSA